MKQSPTETSPRKKLVLRKDKIRELDNTDLSQIESGAVPNPHQSPPSPTGPSLA